MSTSAFAREERLRFVDFQFNTEPNGRCRAEVTLGFGTEARWRGTAEGLASDDPCLGVVARLTEAQGHLRVATRSALRRQWERSQQILLTAADVGEREQASSRLLEVLRYVVLHPNWVR